MIAFECTTEFMGNISNDNVCFAYHPFVSVRNSVFFRDFFKLGINNKVKKLTLATVVALVLIGSYKNQLSRRVISFEFFCAIVCKAVKGAIATKIKIT